MTLLPPRVGEVDVDRVKRPCRQAVAQERQRVATGHADVRAAALRQPRRGEELVLAYDLDAREVDVRVILRRREEEQPLAEAHLQLNRVVVPEGGGPGERRGRVGDR